MSSTWTISDLGMIQSEVENLYPLQPSRKAQRAGRKAAAQKPHQKPHREIKALQIEEEAYETYECYICMEDTPVSEGTYTCSAHFCCTECLLTTFERSLQNADEFPARCCANHQLSYVLSLDILGEDLRARYMHRLYEYYTPLHLRVYCTNASCAAWVPPSKFDDSDHRWSIAPCACGSETCVGCKKAWNEKHICESNDDPRAKPDWLPPYTEDCRIKKCPKCHTLIQHKEACNHMTCGHCSHEFCFICLVPWAISHENAGCPFYGEPAAGYDEEEYERTARGLHRLDGRDRDGFDRLGLDRHGQTREQVGIVRQWRDAGSYAEAHTQNQAVELEYDENGYDQDGFDRNGFDPYGFDRDGYDESGFDRYGFDRDGYDRSGYDDQGYDPDGYDRQGYDRAGYDEHGFDPDGIGRDGYDEEGYSYHGYGRDGYDREGYDEEGLDREGFDCDGYDRYGYDKEGLDYDGHDQEGLDEDGYNREGFDRYGYNRDGGHRDDLYPSEEEDMDERSEDEVETPEPNAEGTAAEQTADNGNNRQVAIVRRPVRPYVPYISPWPTFKQLFCAHRWSNYSGSGCCPICDFSMPYFHYRCTTCQIRVCRYCALDFKERLDYFCPDFACMVTPILWAEAGVVPFRQDKLDAMNMEPKYEGVRLLFDMAEAELWDVQPWLYIFGTQELFEQAEWEAEQKQNLEDPKIYVRIEGERMGWVPLPTDCNVYDVLSTKGEV